MRTVTTAQVATTEEAKDDEAARAGAGGAGRAGRRREGGGCEVDQLVGPKRHDPERTAKRHAHEDGSVTLGGRRVAVSRPRARSAGDEREVPLATYRHFADRDPLTELVFEQMLAGVSTRRFARTREPVGVRVLGRALPQGERVATALLFDLVDRGLDTRASR